MGSVFFFKGEVIPKLCHVQPKVEVVGFTLPAATRRVDADMSRRRVVRPMKSF